MVKNKLISYFLPVSFFAFILWMIVSANMDHSNVISDVGKAVPYGDKVGHFTLFGTLALLLNMALGFRQVGLWSRKFHLGSVLVLLFAVMEECTQLAFHSRTFDPVDILFDLIGISLLSSMVFRKYIARQVSALANYLNTTLMVK